MRARSRAGPHIDAGPAAGVQRVRRLGLLLGSVSSRARRNPAATTPGLRRYGRCTDESGTGHLRMPRQERAERTRRAILDAAAAEFDAHGYEGARLDRIIERTDATKGAVYFHFPSKLDIARALVEEKYANWPVIIGEVAGSGLRGLAAAEEVTQRVAHVFATDVRVRAAMKLSQSILPPPVDDNPYDRWVGVIAMFVRQELDDGPSGDDDAREIATMAVHTFFGAYMIGQELGRLATLHDDVARMWRVLAASVALRRGAGATEG